MLTIRDVQRAVAYIYNVSLHDLVCERRCRDFAEPRQIAMWICGAVLTDKSNSQIARSFRRDRTTITHGMRRGREITARNLDHIEKVRLIIDELRRKASS